MTWFLAGIKSSKKSAMICHAGKEAREVYKTLKHCSGMWMVTTKSLTKLSKPFDNIALLRNIRIFYERYTFWHLQQKAD